MIADSLINGHILASDWLLLIAAVVFVIAAVTAAIPFAQDRPAPVWLGHGFLIAVGLALVAIGWLIV